MAAERKTLAEMAGDTLREAAILIAVFAWLDRAVQGEEFLGAWSWEILGLAVLLFVAGVAIERRRLPE
jgi:hypothetical protein